METRVSRMLGVDFPIFGFSHCRDVVAAVTNSGGVGVLGAVDKSPEELDVDLKWLREETHGRPFGIDILVPLNAEHLTSSELDGDRGAALLPTGHVSFINKMLDRYGVSPLPAGDRGRLLGISPGNVGPEGYRALVDVAFAHNIPFLASALGTLPPDLLADARRRGTVVAALVGSPVHAERHQAAGVDIIVAQGTEAGGHTGEISTMVLIPQVVDAVAPTPVVAAGGIASGRQIAAARALGAEGVWLGSVWLTTAESELQPHHLDKLLAARSGDTVRSRSMSGKPCRMLRSAWTDEWERPEAPQTLPMPLQSMLVAEARERIDREATREGSGAKQLSTFFVGQVVGYMNRVRPIRQIMEDLVTEYADVVEHFAGELAALSGE